MESEYRTKVVCSKLARNPVKDILRLVPSRGASKVLTLTDQLYERMQWSGHTYDWKG